MSGFDEMHEMKRKLTGIEKRIFGRMDAVTGMLAATQTLVVDALALLTTHDRELVVRLLKYRRIAHQSAQQEKAEDPEIGRAVVGLIEQALELAEALQISQPPGPRGPKH